MFRLRQSQISKLNSFCNAEQLLRMPILEIFMPECSAPIDIVKGVFSSKLGLGISLSGGSCLKWQVLEGGSGASVLETEVYVPCGLLCFW